MSVQEAPLLALEPLYGAEGPSNDRGLSETPLLEHMFHGLIFLVVTSIGVHAQRRLP